MSVFIFLTGPHVVDTIIIPILHVRKLRSNVVTKCMQGHIVSDIVNI